MSTTTTRTTLAAVLAEDPDLIRRVQGYRRLAAATATRATDAQLAMILRDALRHLARRSAQYAARLDRCPGVALAAQINAGMALEATTKGREAMVTGYAKASAALIIPAGLDGNEFIDVLTARSNPRLAHAAPSSVVPEHVADLEDRQDRTETARAV